MLFSSDKSASKYWPRVIYSIALIRLSAWIILITFCMVCFESSAVELNKLIRESRPHFSGLTVEQTRDFLIIYLIFGVLYVLIDRKYLLSMQDLFLEHYCENALEIVMYSGSRIPKSQGGRPRKFDSRTRPDPEKQNQNNPKVSRS